MMKMKLPFPLPPTKNKVQAKNSKKQLENLNQKLEEAAKKFKLASQKGNYELAYEHLLTAYKLAPMHPTILMDMAYTQLRLERFEQAYQTYLNCIENAQSSIDTNVYDGMTEVCYYLNKPAEMKKYGHLALESKKQSLINVPILKIIHNSAPKFNPNHPSENIIAFSLFGGIARYCETAIMNCDLIKQIYPEWTSRFYVDETVPETIQHRLKEKGAEIIVVKERQKNISGLFWRFLVMDDPTVNCFLIRDADSLVSYRERAAVDEWLESGKWFHCMHDGYTHTELILAGMWGGFTGIFNNIQNQIESYIKTGKYLNQRVMDQHFLRYEIWPTLQQSVMIHDSYGFEALAQPFPEYQKQTSFEKEALFHVGMNEGSAQISVNVTIPEVSKVQWFLTDEKGQEICRYIESVRPDRTIVVFLLRSYAQKLQTGEWKLHIDSVENID
jgi:tetratricopeptide (TPR) repeat protein